MPASDSVVPHASVPTHVGPLSELAQHTPLWMERTSTAPTAEQLAAVGVGETPKAGQAWPALGAWVGVRLNLNLLRSTGLPVQTLHRGSPPKSNGAQAGGFFRGRALGYCGAVEVANAHFSVNQTMREHIAQGKSAKMPMASVDGQLVSRAPQTFDGIEVAFNPAKSHLFVDAKGRAVKFAELAVVCGHRVYVRGRIVWHDEASAPARTGNAPSLATVREGVDSLGLQDPQTPISTGEALLESTGHSAPRSVSQGNGGEDHGSQPAASVPSIPADVASPALTDAMGAASVSEPVNTHALPRPRRFSTR